MNTTLREVLRDTIAQQSEQSDAPPPTRLVENVIGRYRRRRTIRAAAAGVAVVTAAAVAVPLALDARGTREPTAAAWTGDRVVITALSRAVRLKPDPGASGHGSVGFRWFALLLDPETGRYDELPQEYSSVTPSPDGRWAVIRVAPARQERTGVLDRANGQVRWLDIDKISSADASWSPDSTRFVLTQQARQAIVVNAATLATTPVVPVPPLNPPIGGATFVWSPSGDRLLATDRTTDSDVSSKQLAEYDLTGRRLRTLPISLPLASSAQFSSDGGRIALLDRQEVVDVSRPERPPQARIVDAATGAVESGVVPLPAGTYRIVAWYDADHLVVAMTDAKGSDPGVAALKVVRIADGRVVHTVELPGGHQFMNVQLAPADGLSEVARKHAF